MVDTALFPYAALAGKFELYYSGVWNDITSYVRMEGDSGEFITITRGRKDEATRPDPATASFQLNNIDGRFSPRNPRSPLYGLIGRNTPFRFSITWNAVTYRRFWGEISQWPVQWEPSAADVWVDIVASGITRRINQQSGRVISPVHRMMDGRTSVAAYWPMEDPFTSTGFGSGLTTGQVMYLKKGASSLASDSSVPGSSELPSLDTGHWIGPVTSYTPTTKLQVTWVQAIDSAPAADGILLSWTTTGTAGGWAVVLRSDGALELRAYASAGTGGARVLTQLLDGVFLTGSMIPVGHVSRWSVELTQSGSDISYQVRAYYIDSSYIGSISTGSATLAGYTFGRVVDVRLNDPGTPVGSATVGHVAVVNDILDVSVSGTWRSADIGYAGEYPIVRLTRVCSENGIPLDPWDAFSPAALSASTKMGAQPVASVSEIIAECQDLGAMVFDNKEALGLRYVDFEYRYAGKNALACTYGQLVPPLVPVDDDRNTLNDVTVNRKAGAGARYQVTSGPLSTQNAPAGVGIYDADVTLNLASDDLPQWWAQWLAAAGTWDEARWPVLHLNLLEDVAQTLIPQVLQPLSALDGTGFEFGNKITVSTLPDFLPGGPLELVLYGYSETLGPWCWDVDLNTGPYGPWRGWVVEDTTRGHVDTAGSVTSGSFVAGTGTSLTVITNTGPVWVRAVDQAAALPFDIMVAGCQLRVTAVTSATSPQTFTVSTTVVNGVIKTIPSGSAVNIVPVKVAV